MCWISSARTYGLSSTGQAARSFSSVSSRAKAAFSFSRLFQPATIDGRSGRSAGARSSGNEASFQY